MSDTLRFVWSHKIWEDPSYRLRAKFEMRLDWGHPGVGGNPRNCASWLIEDIERIDAIQVIGTTKLLPKATAIQIHPSVSANVYNQSTPITDMFVKDQWIC